ncbi:unnamed protein product [Tilletia caries]|nr:unnamed protein product [Tilletia caries]
MQKAVVATRQLYQWFEAQKNYYTSHDFSICDFVDMVWTGHGGDSPRGASARSFRAEFASTVHKKDQATLVSTGGAVYRHHFECQGLCSTSADTEDEHTEDEDGDNVGERDTAYDDARAWRGANAKKAEKKRVMCSTSVRLLVEAGARDIEKCTIYQKGSHAKASSTKALRYSRRLRLHIMEQDSGGHRSDSKSVRQAVLSDAYTPASGSPGRWLGTSNASTCRFFCSRRPLRGGQPGQHLCLPASEITKTSKRFTVGVKSTWSIQNLIRWNGRAVFMDSSWRNKNENRAPLTFVTTTNAAGHMVPCVAYLSTDTTSRSFQHLLRALENEVVAEAARVCSDDDRTPL